jgi:CO/xanthine dehydrogenase Mo-binding subunit
MAMDEGGKILALKVHTIANLGAYLSTFSSSVPTYLYVDQPLDDEGRLRPTGAAIGVDRRGIGVDAIHLAAHGRDHVTHAEMAMDEGGKILALKVHTIANLGAYPQTVSSA